MKEKFLLGATVDNEIVFGEFELRHPKYWSKEKGSYTDESVWDFSASFDTVRPFNGENFDLEEYFEDWVENFGKEELYDMCERFDCRPSELPKNLADECYDVRDAIDCSLYSECYEVNGESWYFESGSCGQHDTRDEMEEIINEEAYNLLHELWDNYHLKKVADDGIVEQVEKLANMLSNVDEEAWIIDYIERHEDELN